MQREMTISCRLLSAALCVLGLLGQRTAVAQSTWTNVAVASGPGARSASACCFDENRNKAVLFGGIAFVGTLNDTWEYDGLQWTQKAILGPPAGSAAAMAYDSVRNVCVLFGGSFRRTDTWEYDGVSWKTIITTGPRARLFHAMAYDQARGVVVMTAGITGLSYFDCWEWDGISWRASQAPIPPQLWSRLGHAMCYDVRRRRVILHGGGFQPLGDTWFYDGTTWTPGPAGPQLTHHNMAYSYDRDSVIVFGGETPIASTSDDTWELDLRTNTWSIKALPAKPPAREAAASCYDSVRERMVLFGGQGAVADFSDTWEFQALRQPVAGLYGTGCSGMNGIPQLATQEGRFPWVGEVLPFSLTNGSSQPPLLLLGFSRSQWLSLTLPFDCGSIGMPGCTALASGDVALPMTSSGTSATASVQVPALPSIVGTKAYCQGVVSDATANVLGLTLSNGVQLVLGAK